MTGASAIPAWGGVKRRMSFNASAGTYHRGRPPYPDAVFDLLTSRCGLRPSARVLDIGAGSGLATGPLLAAGAAVVAVEPGADLAAILSKNYACDRLDIRIADLETADLPTGFDLAVAATSLHWLDPDRAIKKVAGVVRPGGWLAAFWNGFGDTNRPTPFRDRLDDVYSDLLPAEPSYRSSRWHALDTERWSQHLTAGGWFTNVEVHVVEWHQTLTADTARDLWSTFPNIAALEQADRDQFLTRLGSIIDDEHGGTVDDPRLTVTYTAIRTAA